MVLMFKLSLISFDLKNQVNSFFIFYSVINCFFLNFSSFFNFLHPSINLASSEI